MDESKADTRYTPPGLKEDLDGCPMLQQLVAALKQSNGFLSSIPQLGSFLESFQKSNELSWLITREIRNVARGSTSERPPSYDKFTAYQDARFALTIERIGPAQRSDFLTTAYSGAEVRILQSSGEVSLTTYSLPQDLDFTTLDKDVTLKGPRTVVLSDQYVGANFNSGDIVSISCSGTAIMMTLSERATVPYSWGFNRETLEPLFVASTSQSLTRVKTMVDLISAFHQTEYQVDGANEFLLQVGKHDEHFLRWSACQVLAKIDLSDALPLLIRLVDDPHISVQRAARAALARVSNRSKASEV